MGTNGRTHIRLDGSIFPQYSGISSHSKGARIVQPKNDDVDEDATYDEVLTHEKYAQNQPIIPVPRESNEPIVEWTDNKTLLTGAFPDNFLFGQSVPIGLPT